MFLALLFSLVETKAFAKPKRPKAHPRVRAQESAPAAPPPDLNRRRLIEEAFGFFESEEDPASYVALSEEVLKLGLRDSVVLERIAGFYLKNKDRASLNRFFEEVSRRFACRTAERDLFLCSQMRELWNGNLDSVFFFEDSASKAERLRRLLLDKDCSAAQAVLKDLSAREGLSKPLLEGELRIAECLADIATQDRLRTRIEELRLFPSDL